MATWVTHLMIADELLKIFPWLDRRGFCVGNIAPDCNVENADWTEFTPPRAVTHWMQGRRKTATDCDAFCRQYILVRDPRPKGEEYAFLLGYYAHLIADAEFQRVIRDPARVHAAWLRVQADPGTCTDGLEESWDNIKRLIPKERRMAGMYSIEAEYLERYPDSGYLTEILPLKEFPDYIDYLPKGAIVRKIGVMGFVPQADPDGDFLAMSREEYAAFMAGTVRLTAERFREMELVPQSEFDTVTACGECCAGCRKKAAGLCQGCRESDGYCQEWAGSGGCPIHRCTREHGVLFCGLCPEFPCNWLVRKVTWRPNFVEELTALAEKYRDRRR